MPALIVKLPHDRDFCGEIRLIGDGGAVLAGPFGIAGRAVAGPAQAAGNSARSPLARFGDTPTGRYKVRDVLPCGAGTVYREEVYGDSGIIVLDPCSGDAALAEANGRFHVFIQGGITMDGRLCATNGALRMRNAELAILCGLLGDAEAVECWCVEDAGIAAGGAVVTDNAYDEGDPPPLIKRKAGREVSRRRVLAGGAALSVAPSLVLLPGIFVAAESPPALAQTAYQGNPDSGQGQDQNQDQQSPPDEQQENPPQPEEPENDQNNNGDDTNPPKAY